MTTGSHDHVSLFTLNKVLAPRYRNRRKYGMVRSTCGLTRRRGRRVVSTPSCAMRSAKVFQRMDQTEAISNRNRASIRHLPQARRCHQIRIPGKKRVASALRLAVERRKTGQPWNRVASPWLQDKLIDWPDSYRRLLPTIFCKFSRSSPGYDKI